MTMQLPHGFTPEYAERAVAICSEAKADGRLWPLDAHDVVSAIASSVHAGTSVPETIGELALVSGVLSLVPYHEGDGK